LSESISIISYKEAVLEIKYAILQSRYRAVANANAELLALYYGVGRYVSTNTRSGRWGIEAIETISNQLQGEMPGLRGFSPSNIKNMRLFYEQWVSEFETNRQSPNTVSRKVEILSIQQLPTAELETNRELAFFRVGFTHHMEILRKCMSQEERWYYIIRCANEFWNVHSLKNHLRADDFFQYGKMPNNFVHTIHEAKSVSKAIRSFKEEYLLDFIDIKDVDDYDERDVENAIVSQIRNFIMTIGEGFCFIGNQYRILVDDVEFYIDLLFFNRNLQCLVAFELKRDKFRPADLGQLGFYLSALDKYVKKPYENKTIGILLCQEMNKTIVELAVQDYNKPMGVATYRLGTEIPESYRSLIPVIDGVQQILSENGEKERTATPHKQDEARELRKGW
jgi:predicted nuclease of restriction endonuclease-like (RecB) superfamily